MNSITPAMLIIILIAGVLIGALVLYFWTRGSRYRLERDLAALQTQAKVEQAVTEERAAALAQAEQRIAASFGKLANESLAHNSESFLRLARESLGKHQVTAKAELSEREKAIKELVKPLQDSLEKAQKQIGEIEKTRHETFGSIKAQLDLMTVNQEALQTHTRNLVNALRRPEVRGRWGELTLHRVVELAGMVEHCDFVEQPHVETEDGAIRPDMIIRLPDRGEVIVDVKTPLDAYLQAIEAPDDETRKTALERHTRNLMDRVRELGSKAYWSQFESSPEFVILFVPGDQFLSAALGVNPNLIEEALRNKVIITTPTSLIALLKAVAYGWRQLSLAENAEEIRRLAQDLHGRLTTFTGHIAKVGKQLDGSVKAYNQAVGSLERSVLPGARKFTELGVAAKKPLEQITEIETLTRQVGDVEKPQVEQDKPKTEAPAAPPEPADRKADDASKTH